MKFQNHKKFQLLFTDFFIATGCLSLAFWFSFFFLLLYFFTTDGFVTIYGILPSWLWSILFSPADNTPSLWVGSAAYLCTVWNCGDTKTGSIKKKKEVVLMALKLFSHMSCSSQTFVPLHLIPVILAQHSNKRGTQRNKWRRICGSL